MASDSDDNFSLMDAESSFGGDDDSFSDAENIVVARKKPAAVPGANAKKSTSSAKAAATMKKNILSPSKEVNANVDTTNQAAKAKKTIEDKYQKKTQLEHILLRKWINCGLLNC